MSNINALIVLNAGKQTVHSFLGEFSSTSVKCYHSKKLMLHLNNSGDVRFVDENAPISFNGAYVFIRLRGNDDHFCGILAEYLEHAGIPFNDPVHFSYPHGAGKIAQMLKLSLARIRIPETFIFREESFVAQKEYLRSNLTFPAIFKTDGSRGENVMFCETMEKVEALLKQKPPHKLALVQPFIENTFDTRTIVAYGEVLGSISRTRKSGHLNNLAQGATAAAYTLSITETDVAVRAAKACGIDIAGVDMIPTEHGPIVLEVNKSPQVAGFESVHNFKVFTRVAQIIRARYMN